MSGGQKKQQQQQKKQRKQWQIASLPFPNEATAWCLIVVLFTVLVFDASVFPITPYFIGLKKNDGE